MSRSTLARRRRQTLFRFAVLAAVLSSIWFAEKSVIARWNKPTEAQVAFGRTLFEHKWTENDPLSGDGDGLGPVFNATSCVECHFQGAVGGGGPNKFNVKTFEILPTKREPLPMAGIVHAAAIRDDLVETASTVRRHNPIVKDGMKVIGGCRIEIKDFDPIHYDTSNTPALFGMGQIDQISTFAIRTRALRRTIESAGGEFDLAFHSTPTGRIRVLPDGRIGKFGWKAQFATLREFTAAACAGELGLSNPMKRQHVAQEYREDTTATLDMDRQQFSALVAYVGHLPVPRRELPSDPAELTLVERGEAVFESVGCADCHVPNMDQVKGVYSDFALHRLVDDDSGGYRKEPDVPLPKDHPDLDEWKTPPLWGVADSAPYFHDGASPDLQAAIQRHAGSAKHVRRRYNESPDLDRVALIAFLKTLRAPQGDQPTPDRAVAER